MNKTCFQIALLWTLLAPLAGQNPNPHHAHGVDQRGDLAMGFSHLAADHHFLVREDGGVISVSAKDRGDGDSVARIRHHLGVIVAAFRRGDFSKPKFIHDQTPPGVETMKRLGDQIEYRYTETEAGADVSIASGNPEAVKAIHDFLRFQITDHRTGDPLEVPAPTPS